METARALTVDDCLTVNRINLGNFAEQFRIAVDLFTLLERGGGPPNTGIFGGVFIQYRMIAARDGALAIYHFGCTLDAIKSLVPHSPIAKANIDIENIDKIISLHHFNFPHASAIRNAIAHAGELYNSAPKVRASHQRKSAEFHGGFVSEGGMLSSALYEKTFSIG